jgi:hypothetical protein
MVLALLGLTAGVRGEIPGEINYQGRLVDSSTGDPLTGPQTVDFRILDQEQDGTQLWTETHNVTPDVSGVFTVVLGRDTAISLPFDGPAWLEIEVGGEVLSPRRKLTSVPYAFRAAIADSAGEMNLAAYSDTGHAHDDRYRTRGELEDPGTINQAGNPVDWTRLKNVPAGFADGTDDAGGGPSGDGYSLDASDGDPVDAVYVDAEGNVGVGTVSPSEELSVEGDLNLTGSLEFGGQRALAVKDTAVTILGHVAGMVSQGSFNTFVGYSAGGYNTYGYHNVFLGSLAGSTNETGNLNTCLGHGAGMYNESGGGNTFAGYVAGRSNTTADFNTFLGYYAGTAVLGGENTVVGAAAGALLGKIELTQVVRYRYRNDAGGREHLGVIAEDAPEEITTPDGKAISLGDCAGLLLATVKAQQAEIEALRDELEAIRAELEAGR